jgi:hypothetical protein
MAARRPGKSRLPRHLAVDHVSRWNAASKMLKEEVSVSLQQGCEE